MTHTGSIYNNFDVTQAGTVSKNVKSLAKLCGFNRTNNEKRLGEIKETLTVSEAIVAVPYISMPMNTQAKNKLKANDKSRAKTKKFISIPRRRWNEAINDNSALKRALKDIDRARDTDDTKVAGDSILRLANILEKYVFPPQFDCLHNSKIEPIAMYVFEFDYEFDKDDLSYMWQNIAPRNYKQLTFQSQTVSHNLANNELINREVLSHPGLRWMVFKVKQRANTDYYDLLVDQAGEATRQIDNTPKNKKSRRGIRDNIFGDYKIQFNWPYDYLSFVELIKLDVDILLKKPNIKVKKK